MTPALLVGPAVRQLTSTLSGVKINCVAAKGMVFMPWTPTPEEKLALVAGSPVWVAARGPFIPEMVLVVGNEADVIPADLYSAAVRESVPGGDAAERAVAERRKLQPTPLDRWVARVVAWSILFLGLCLAARWLRA